MTYLKSIATVCALCMLVGLPFGVTTATGQTQTYSNLPDTGIELCYSRKYVIECGTMYNGQDAEYTSNPMSYTDNGDGTVTDDVTGLVWQKCTSGESGTDCETGEAYEMIWEEAFAYCENVDLPGDGWRVPNLYELQSLADYSVPIPGPGIDVSVFPDPGGDKDYGYWTSNPAETELWELSWRFSYHDGSSAAMLLDRSDNFVRCVRGEEFLPGTSYTDNGDGTVTDNVTGLMWQQCTGGTSGPDCSEGGSYKPHWGNALKYCEELVFPEENGYDDWRLPDIKELQSLADLTVYQPAINENFFPGTFQERYWSSSSASGRQKWYAENITFEHGHTWANLKSRGSRVRCVR